MPTYFAIIEVILSFVIKKNKESENERENTIEFDTDNYDIESNNYNGIRRPIYVAKTIKYLKDNDNKV